MHEVLKFCELGRLELGMASCMKCMKFLVVSSKIRAGNSWVRAGNSWVRAGIFRSWVLNPFKIQELHVFKWHEVSIVFLHTIVPFFGHPKESQKLVNRRNFILLEPSVD